MGGGFGLRNPQYCSRSRRLSRQLATRLALALPTRNIPARRTRCVHIGRLPEHGPVMSWYLKVLRQYADFSGRARRMEYWVFNVISLLITIAAVTVDAITGSLSLTLGLGLLSGIYALAVLIPGLAVSVRRLHDSNRSGWWLLLIFIPLLGGLTLLVFMFLGSTPGDNRFGPNPKGE